MVYFLTFIIVFVAQGPNTSLVLMSPFYHTGVGVSTAPVWSALTHPDIILSTELHSYLLTPQKHLIFHLFVATAVQKNSTETDRNKRITIIKAFLFDQYNY